MGVLPVRAQADGPYSEPGEPKVRVHEKTTQTIGRSVASRKTSSPDREISSYRTLGKAGPDCLKGRFAGKYAYALGMFSKHSRKRRCLCSLITGYWMGTFGVISYFLWWLCPISFSSDCAKAVAVTSKHLGRQRFMKQDRLENAARIRWVRPKAGRTSFRLV